MTCFCCLLCHKGLSLPLLTGTLTAITGSASALLNGSFGAGVSEERTSALLNGSVGVVGVSEERASALLNGSVGVVGVSEERESALPILAKGDNLGGNRTDNLALAYYK